MKKLYILIIAVLIVSLGVILIADGKKISKKTLTKKPTMTSEKITFKTTDGVIIVSDWTTLSNAKKAVLLLHMMPQTRGSWAPLSKALNTAGFATLAIDLRGHGESTAQNGKKLDYKKFTDKDHQLSRLDVDAALNFLKGKGFNEDSIGLAGASIGSNLALDAMYRYSGITRGVILSPGLDYRGVLTKPAINGLSPNQKAWLIAADEDEFSAESCKRLHDIRKDSSTLTIFDGIEHGTDLFASEPDLVSDIVKFLGQ